MAKNLIDVGINLNDGTGDNLRTAGTKINNMFQEVYDVFGDGTNLSNLAANLHIVNDAAPQLGGNLDMNGYSLTGNGAINITAQIQTAYNVVAGGALQGATAAISSTSTFGGAVTLNSTLTGPVGNFTTSMTTATLNATTELQVTGPASITGAITSGAAGSKMRFYWANVAAFPSATTYEGGLAYAEDTNRMYVASDTAWVSLAPEASPALTGIPTAPTAVKATNTTQIATTAYVKDVVSDYAPLASPALTGNPTAPTAATADNDTSIATTAHVWANRTALQSNIDLKAPIASPTFTGTPSAPTAPDNTNTTQIASTAFVRAREDIINIGVALKAPIASPTFTGTPAVPTAADGTNTTQIASTAFVTKTLNNYGTTVTTALGLKAPIASPVLTGVPRAPTANSSVSDTQIATTEYVGARIDAKLDDDTYLDLKLTAYAKKESPALTGTPTTPTAAAGTNTTQIASTAFVKSAVDAKITDTNLSQYATKASPSFSGTPLTPTAADGTNTTQIASTAFVKSAVDAKITDINLSQYAKLASPVFSGSPTIPTPPETDDSLKISNTAWVQHWVASYGNVPQWGGSRKTVSTAAPSGGSDGDIWFQIES
jgi:hypothetical protein